MKIIHTADVHLDSPLIGVSNPSARRLELLRALKRLSDYADNAGAKIIVVAGDLFDEKFVKPQTVSGVADIINGSAAQWYILKGNHGASAPYAKLFELCANAHGFADEWTYYNVENVTVCGRESGVDDELHNRELTLDNSRYNVVVLHGDVDSDSYGLIDAKMLAASNANYVALGHRHSFAAFKFGAVKACYSGVLEARGFDETEQTGFVEIDTDSGKISFVPQSLRRVETVVLDVTDVESPVALENKISDAVAQVNSANYLNLILRGAPACPLNATFVAEQLLHDRFFALRVKDETTLGLDLPKLAEEISLRGEFVKLAMEIPDEADRQDVLKLGLSALSGDDLL